MRYMPCYGGLTAWSVGGVGWGGGRVGLLELMQQVTAHCRQSQYVSPYSQALVIFVTVIVSFTMRVST